MRRILELDIRATRALNSISHNAFFRNTMRFANTAGDMPLWILCIVAFPFVFGAQALMNSITAVLALPLSVSIQSAIKYSVKRKRPFHSIPDIVKFGHILDKYSFPSGHTLHAVLFTVILSYQVGYVVLIPLFLMAVLIILSRPGLGIHYVSDVIVGTFIGLIISAVAIGYIHPHSEEILIAMNIVKDKILTYV